MTVHWMHELPGNHQMDVAEILQNLTLKVEQHAEPSDGLQGVTVRFRRRGLPASVTICVGRRQERRASPYDFGAQHELRSLRSTVHQLDTVVQRSVCKMQQRLDRLYEQTDCRKLHPLQSLKALDKCRSILRGVEIDAFLFRLKVVNCCRPTLSDRRLSCFTEVGYNESSDLLPTSPNAFELAAYLDEFLHLPKRMSVMAERMYV